MTRTTQVRVAALSSAEPSSYFPALLLRYCAVTKCSICCIVTCEAPTKSYEAGGPEQVRS